VDKDYVFANPANPFAQQFPEVVNINNVDVSVLDADFVAVKVGDVNGSAITNFAAAGDDRNSVGNFVMTTEDRFVQKGESVTVEFEATDLDIAGFQFTLNFDKNSLELTELLPGVAKEENFGFTMLEEGAVTASWNGKPEAQLFSVTFRATASGQLSKLVSVNSRFTAAEAYRSNGDLLGVQLSFSGNATAAFELYQNTPNPFKGVTVIGFNLPQPGAATLTVSDVSGKVLKVIEGDFPQGYSEVKLNSNDLPSSGVLYYTLSTAEATLTKKMVVVE
jgi:predicted RNA-binding protein with TRAM domain